MIGTRNTHLCSGPVRVGWHRSSLWLTIANGGIDVHSFGAGHAARSNEAGGFSRPSPRWSWWSGSSVRRPRWLRPWVEVSGGGTYQLFPMRGHLRDRRDLRSGRTGRHRYRPHQLVRGRLPLDRRRGLPPRRGPVGRSRWHCRQIRPPIQVPHVGDPVWIAAYDAATPGAGEDTFNWSLSSPSGPNPCNGYGGAQPSFRILSGDIIVETLTEPDPGPDTLDLSPATASNPVGTDQTMTATVRNAGNVPILGAPVLLETGDGAPTRSCSTDAAGECTFTLRSPSIATEYSVRACVVRTSDTMCGSGAPHDEALRAWTRPGRDDLAPQDHRSRTDPGSSGDSPSSVRVPGQDRPERTDRRVPARGPHHQATHASRVPRRHNAVFDGTQATFNATGRSTPSGAYQSLVAWPAVAAAADRPRGARRPGTWAAGERGDRGPTRPQLGRTRSVPWR